MRASNDLLVIVAPDKTEEVLQVINSLAGVDNYQAMLSTDNLKVISELQNKPSWLTVVDASSYSATWEADGLPHDLIVKLTFSLLKEAGVLILKNVPEVELDQLQQALDESLQLSGSDYLYDVYSRGSLVLAIAREGNTRGKVSGHSAAVKSASYSPDGHTILTVSEDGTARVWDTITGRELFIFSDYGYFFTEAQYSPDGSTIITSGVSGLKVWDAQTGKLRLTIGDRQYKTIISQNSITTVSRFDGNDVASVWDAHTGEKRFQAAGNECVYSPDGRNLAIAASVGPTQIWDVSTGQYLFTLPGYSPIYSPNGLSIITRSQDYSATIWDAHTGQPWFSLDEQTVPFGAWRSPKYIQNGDYILTSDGDGNTKVWDAWTGQQLSHIPGSQWAIFSPDGGSLAVFHFDAQVNKRQITFWDTQTVQDLLTVTGTDTLYSPDGSRAVVTQSIPRSKSRSVINGTTEVWEVRSGKKLFTLSGNQAVYSPNKQHILTILDDGRVLVWEALTGQLRATLGQMRVLVRHTGRHGGGGRVEAETGQISLVERFAEVQYPEKVRPEQNFAINVGLLRQAPEGVLDAQAMNLLVTVDAEGRGTGAKPVKVTFTSTAFDLLNVNRAELQVYADKDTEPFTFTLKAKPEVSGLQVVHITFYQGWECLGQIGVVINVVLVAAVIGQANRLNKRMTLRAPIEKEWDLAVPPPDVVLYINRQTCQGRDTLFYEYEWVKEGWSRTEAGKLELRCSVEEWVEARYSALNQFAGTRASGQSRSINLGQRELEKIGENLYYDLFTPQLQAFYRHFAPTAQSLLIYSNEPWIPWEVVKPWGDDLEDGLSDFLCARFQFSRWYMNEDGQRIRSTMELRQLSAIIPSLDLKAVEDEYKCLNALPQKWPFLAVQKLVPRYAYEVLRRMSEGTCNLFHFATHGNQQLRTSPVAAISLGQDSLFVGDIVGKNILVGLKRSTPLIFINACHSGRQEQGLHQLEGWADRFIQFGCSGFIGANWEVHDGLAADFAINFYKALQSDKTVAQAVQEARLALRTTNPTNSTWLAYSLYAHPNLKIRVAT